MPARRSNRHPHEAPADPWRAAVHEAGHAVVCVLTRRRIIEVILPMGRSTLGAVHCDDRLSLDPRTAATPARASANLIREIIIGWSGYVAEQLVFGRGERGGLLDDARRVTALLARLERGKRQRNALGRLLLQESRALLSRRRGMIERIARALLRKGRLSGSEVRRLVRPHVRCAI